LAKNILPFEVFGIQIPITLVRRKGQKHINIRVHHDASVTVSAPIYASNARVHEAVRIKENWIRRHVERTREQISHFDELSELPLGGVPHRVSTEYDPTRRGRVWLDEKRRTVIMRTGSENRQPRIEALVTFLKKQCTDVITPEVHSLSKPIKVNVHRIFYRNQKTRWGSSSAKGNISLNFRVALLPPEVRSYLIIHELIHQVHMNHSDTFWKRIAKVCPNYLISDRWLKEHSFYLGLFR
jgi:predicted metal-dependent hydrolase